MNKHVPITAEAPNADVASNCAVSEDMATPAIVNDATLSLPTMRAWDEIPPLKLNPRRLTRNRIVTATRTDPNAVAIDILRTKLMAMIRANGWKTLAITSPRGGCGKTTLALNLAFSMVQQGNFKLGLVDLDLRRPNVARLLDCQGAGALEGFLRGRKNMTQSLFRHGYNLVVAPNAVHVDQPAELLGEAISGPSIPYIREALGLDLILYDLPPMLAADDALMVLPAVDAMLLVAAAGETTISEIEACERDLSQPGKLAGIVLNKCQYLPDRYGY